MIYNKYMQLPNHMSRELIVFNVKIFAKISLLQIEPTIKFSYAINNFL
jgi:hypothetical protein